ncbi:hypothetical protein IE077_001642 [Cardiosporidium cionae]|uniref:Uncharacterized protein n=1 Tax=Cardiosporidium cionae TaxID=476202 RepID=A0ABQ7JCL7_9APIC|nr:hypothetical protein IE077_001642 [Cardiosporidium cionae]|eukprot:KAF8821743.1 hypothetical protein IE077_001642 [Cardiosporidium cionae]
MFAVKPIDYNYGMPSLQQSTLVKHHGDSSTSLIASDSSNEFAASESPLETEGDLVMDSEVSTDNGKESAYPEGPEIDFSQEEDFQALSEYVEDVKLEYSESLADNFALKTPVDGSMSAVLAKTGEEFAATAHFPTSMHPTLNQDDADLSSVMFLKDATSLSLVESLSLLPMISSGTDETTYINTHSLTSASSWSTPSNMRSDDALVSGSEHGEMQSMEGNMDCTSSFLEDSTVYDLPHVEMAAELAILPSEAEMAAELAILPSEDEMAVELEISSAETERIVLTSATEDSTDLKQTRGGSNADWVSPANPPATLAPGSENVSRVALPTLKAKDSTCRGKPPRGPPAQRGASYKRKAAGNISVGEMHGEYSEKKLSARVKDGDTRPKTKDYAFSVLVSSSGKKESTSPLMDETVFDDEEKPKKFRRSDSSNGTDGSALGLFSATSAVSLETVPFPLLVQLMVLALRDVYDVCTSNYSASVPYSLTDLQYRFHWREILKARSTEELWDYCSIFGPALKEHAALLAVHPEKLVRIVAQLEFLMTERLNVYTAAKRDNLLVCVDTPSTNTFSSKSNVHPAITPLLNGSSNTTKCLTKSFSFDICGNKAPFVAWQGMPSPPGKTGPLASEFNETMNNEVLLAKCLGLNDFSSISLPSEGSQKNARSLSWKVKKSKSGSSIITQEELTARSAGTEVKESKPSAANDADSHISTTQANGLLRSRTVVSSVPSFGLKKMEERYDSSLVQAPPPPGDSIPQRVQNRNEGKWRDGQLDDSWAYAFPLIHKIRCLAMKNINIRWARERTAVGGSWVVGKGRGYCWRCSPKDPTPESVRETFHKALLERNKSFGPLKDIENATIDAFALVSAPLGEALELRADGLKKAADAMLEIHRGRVSRDPTFYVEWDLYACSFMLRLNRKGETLVKYFKTAYGDALGVLEALDAMKEWVDSGAV